MESVFESARAKNYPYRYHVAFVVDELHGGFPQNKDVAVEHIKRKIQDNDDLLRDAVVDYLAEQKANEETPTPPTEAEINERYEEAVKNVAAKNLNGFRRDDHGLYMPGRNLKSCLKEGASIAVNAGRIDLKNWGVTNKWFTKWLPEHIFVLEDKLHLGRDEADGIDQRFTVTRYGTAIQLEEFITDAKLEATVVTDVELSDDQWAALWTTCEMNGIGASRSQGYGRFTVTVWDRI